MDMSGKSYWLDQKIKRRGGLVNVPTFFYQIIWPCDLEANVEMRKAKKFAHIKSKLLWNPELLDMETFITHLTNVGYYGHVI